jgi:hypothetical protein
MIKQFVRNRVEFHKFHDFDYFERLRKSALFKNTKVD